LQLIFRKLRSTSFPFLISIIFWFSPPYHPTGSPTMMKRIVVAFATVCSVASPALAEGWADAPGVNGQQGQQQYTSGGTDTVNFYNPQQPPTNDRGYGPSPGIWGNTHSSGHTSTQGIGWAEVANSAPLLGSMLAPGNMALKAEGKSSLPQTRLDSIVAATGYSDEVFGDEGTDGPPPLGDFATIGEAGGVTATTGHQSNAPSAWGYPN
jgi:hypothetical protein